VLGDESRALIIHRLSDDRHSRFLTRAYKQPKSFDSEALERIWRAARLERATAQRTSACRASNLCRANYLGLGFDGAWTCDDRDVSTTERHAWGDRDYSWLLTPFAGDLLVRLCDVNDANDAGQRFDPASVDAAVVSDDPDSGALSAGHWVRGVSHLFDNRDDAFYVRRGRAMAHDYKHDALNLRCSARRLHRERMQTCASNSGRRGLG
jgi:hypothetical protein